MNEHDELIRRALVAFAKTDVTGPEVNLCAKLLQDRGRTYAVIYASGRFAAIYRLLGTGVLSRLVRIPRQLKARVPVRREQWSNG